MTDGPIACRQVRETVICIKMHAMGGCVNFIINIIIIINYYIDYSACFSYFKAICQESLV